MSSAPGFQDEALVLNRRCIQSICDVADAVHRGAYEATESAVKEIPPEFAHHLGTYIVRESDVAEYIKVFDPMVLRWSVTSGAKLLPALARCYNFGSSKGLSFDCVLVLPAESQMHFVLDGRKPFPAQDETAQNKMYVAITRARYSLGFIVPDKKVEGLRFPVWAKAID